MQSFVRVLKPILDEMIKGNRVILTGHIYPEVELKWLAEELKNIRNRDEIIFDLINDIPNLNRNYDWNVGSILQHFKVDIVINSIIELKSPERFYNSIGLSWVLGEFKNRDRAVVDFLYAIVRNSKDSDAWWRAAFSIEKLEIEEAINLLKRSLKTRELKSLNYYLDHLDDKRAVISILILSNADIISHTIYPRIRNILLSSSNHKIIINCCWLIGRLKLIDEEILTRLISLMSHKNYELRYYTFFALQNNATERLRPLLEKALKDKDPLIRKMAARSLLNIGNEVSLRALEKALYSENQESVISELSNGIYFLRNPHDKNKLSIELKSYKNENGLIIDESDKWYRDPAIYDIFSESEDPENVCFNLIQQKISDKKISNPIDLATGTGRMLWQILDKIPFEGTLCGVDISRNMCKFVEKNIKRERRYAQPVCIIRSSIKDLPKKLKIKSNFIISSFGFPSRVNDKNLCLEEIKAVNTLLAKDGIFVTIGWDESFNDELGMMWFKYIPDKIKADDFEEWRKKRADAISSPRNCDLRWFKRGLLVPLQFSSLKEAAHIMGYLFGRDAVQYIVRNNKTEWGMSLGITFNTKKELKSIIRNYGKRN